MEYFAQIAGCDVAASPFRKMFFFILKKHVPQELWDLDRMKQVASFCKQRGGEGSTSLEKIHLRVADIMNSFVEDFKKSKSTEPVRKYK